MDFTNSITLLFNTPLFCVYPLTCYLDLDVYQTQVKILAKIFHTFNCIVSSYCLISKGKKCQVVSFM